jgi:hypothetical protein
MPLLVDEAIVGEREKILAYGGFGTGKTFASGTMPGHVYHLVFGGPNELKTLRSPDFMGMYPDAAGKHYFDFVKESLGLRGTFTQANAYDWACDRLDEALLAEEKGDFRFDSLVLDGATGLRSFGMNKAIEITSDMASSTAKTALTRLKNHGIIIAGDNDWGAEQSLTMKFLNWCFEMDKHLLVITHEWRQEKHDRKSRETTVVHVSPLFTGKHRIDVPAMFDNVWRFTVSGGERSRVFEVQTVGDDIVDAKTRYGGLLGAMERNMNFEAAIEKFKEHQRQQLGQVATT